MKAIRSSKLSIIPLAGNIGAEVAGIDAGAGLSEESFTGLRQALLRHKVVFLRCQDLTYADMVALGQRFGSLTLGHPIYAPLPEKPHLREFDSRSGVRANHWHSDLTFLDRPPAVALLRSIVVPPVGGDTMWANCVSAYQSLSAELRELATRLRIVHSNDSDYTHATVAQQGYYTAKLYEAEHAAVQSHPETREHFLLVGGFARRIVGLDPQASRDVIRVLQDHVTRPEHTVRWRWHPGDLAIWDNLATQHYAIFDYGQEHRRNERVTVAGPVPRGLDGRSSKCLSGDSSSYNLETAEAVRAVGGS